MRIWVDADSCPRPVRDIVAGASTKSGIQAIFVANTPVPHLMDGRPSGGSGKKPPEYEGPAPSSLISMVIVEAGPDKADDYIEKNAVPPDLVVTRDIPLASRLVDLGLSVLNDRGTVYTRESVRNRLIERDLMLAVRSSPDYPEGRPHFDEKKAKAFAECLDREIVRIVREESLARISPGSR
jgi:uncharacterized protein